MNHWSNGLMEKNPLRKFQTSAKVICKTNTLHVESNTPTIHYLTWRNYEIH